MVLKLRKSVSNEVYKCGGRRVCTQFSTKSAGARGFITDFIVGERFTARCYRIVHYSDNIRPNLPVVKGVIVSFLTAAGEGCAGGLGGGGKWTFTSAGKWSFWVMRRA